MTQDFRGSLLSFPGSTVVPLSPNELITNVTFIPLARKGPVPGVLADAVYYGAFRMAWAVSLENIILRITCSNTPS